ncbi:MAG: cyclic nucleotide-binding domain-containing protein [Myxococcales bacterium]|nr:cyclic nucleotide-binding domain-containing protein [Myxococcales bacterium]
MNEVDAATARRRFQIHRVEPGTLLVEEGTVGRALLCLIEGELEVCAGETVVAVVSQPGSLLGETALFEDNVRTASVVARAPSVVWSLEREGYEELRDTLHPITRNLEITAIAEQVVRLHDVGDRVIELALGTPPTPPPTGFFAAVRRLFGLGGARPATANVRSCLARSPLFADAPPMVLDLLAPRFTSWRCDPGTLLCTEGERGDKMFVLEEGEVDVVVAAGEEPRVVATLSPGQAFGMVSLASGAPRMSSCITRGEALVHQLDAATWSELSDEVDMGASTFRRAMIRALAEQLRHANQQVATAISTGDPKALDAVRSGM